MKTVYDIPTRSLLDATDCVSQHFQILTLLSEIQGTSKTIEQKVKFVSALGNKESGAIRTDHIVGTVNKEEPVINHTPSES